MIDVSIIIVSYNTNQMTMDCIRSIKQYTEGLDIEIIVSDNGSTDNSVEDIRNNFSDVILLENKENLGFGAANNKGLEIAKGKYVFFLNSDTLLKNNAIKYFYDYWENSNEEILALGAFLQDEEGYEMNSYGPFPSYGFIAYVLFRDILSCLFGKYKKTDFQRNKSVHDKNISIDGYITGADLFMKNNGLRFDERYFMYFEESDMLYNLGKSCTKKVILNKPKIIHLEGGSDKTKAHRWYSFKKQSSIYYWISCFRYLRKNIYKPIRFTMLKAVVKLVWRLPHNAKATRPYLQELENA